MLGALIPRSGELRKVRWQLPGTGRRRGVRVIYYWCISEAQIHVTRLRQKRSGKSHAEAIEVIQAIINLDPASGDGYDRLALSEFALGNNEAALNALRLGEQLNRGSVEGDVRPQLAYGYGLLKQPEDAQRAFDKFNEIGYAK